jgi:hypothetical protein
MMNIRGYSRGVISRNLCAEKFLVHVAETIETQLKEWDENYEVWIMKFQEYALTVKKGELYYHLNLSEKEIDSLQKENPYSLDRKIWKELEKQGLPIIKGYGNYIDSIL